MLFFMFQSYDFTFGDGGIPDFNYKELKRVCPNCNEDVSFVDKTFKHPYCDVCGKVRLITNN